MGEPGRSMLICDVGPVRFALALADVVAILPILPMWRPPTLPRPLIGFVTVRGVAVAVLSPALLFDGDAPMPDAIDLYAHLVRVAGDVALLVDRADAVVTGAVVRAADLDLSYRGCVMGTVETGGAGGVAHLLSVGRLMAEGAAARIAARRAEAQRQAAKWAA